MHGKYGVRCFHMEETDDTRVTREELTIRPGRLHSEIREGDRPISCRIVARGCVSGFCCFYSDGKLHTKA